MYNLAIIGGGPAGYCAAEKAAAAGWKVVLFEREALGGTCLNVGCIPTKTLLYSAKQYVNAQQAGKYGVSASEVGFDYQKIQQRKQKVVRKLVAGIRQRMQQVEVVTGEAHVLSRTDACVAIGCNEQTYEAERLLICTGSSNFVPPIPGLQDNPAVWSSTEALNAKELPGSVAIIGGGVIGMEFATLYMELGVQVTVIEAMPHLLGVLDQDVVELVRAKYEKAGVRFLLNTRVTRVEGNEVFYEDGSVTAERILVSVGRTPTMQGLEQLAGMETFRKGIVVDDHMRTSLPNVWAAGDVTGKILLAHVASRQAEVAVENMLGGEIKMDYSAIPSVVYTNPEIAQVGMTAAEVGERAEVHQLPMTYSGRFVAENEGEMGLCKMVVDADSKQVLGVQMVGNPCSEFVAAAAMAVQSGLTISDFHRFVFPHPTVSEILKEVL